MQRKKGAAALRRLETDPRWSGSASRWQPGKTGNPASDYCLQKAGDTVSCLGSGNAAWLRCNSAGGRHRGHPGKHFLQALAAIQRARARAHAPRRSPRMVDVWRGHGEARGSIPQSTATPKGGNHGPRTRRTKRARAFFDGRAAGETAPELFLPVYSRG